MAEKPGLTNRLRDQISQVPCGARRIEVLEPRQRAREHGFDEFSLVVIVNPPHTTNVYHVDGLDEALV